MDCPTCKIPLLKEEPPWCPSCGEVFKLTPGSPFPDEDSGESDKREADSTELDAILDAANDDDITSQEEYGQEGIAGVSDPSKALDGGAARFTWGYIYASLCFAAALLVWHRLISEAYIRLPRVFAADTPSALRNQHLAYLTLGSLWGTFLVLASIAIFRKHRFSMGIVYIIALASLGGVLARGVIPSELGAWFVFNVPFVVYFRRRRAISQSSAPFRSASLLSKYWKALALSASGIVAVSLGLYYHSSREYYISGEIMRPLKLLEITQHSTSPLKTVAGAKVAIYGGNVPDRPLEFFYNSVMSTYIAKGFCDIVFQHFKTQFGETPLEIDAKFRYRPYKNTALEEWREIEQDADFQFLSASYRRDVKRYFWSTRVYFEEPLRKFGDITTSELNEGEWTLEVWRVYSEFFRGEMADLSLLKPDSVSELGVQPLVETVTDSQGTFSLQLKRGRYLFVAEEKYPYANVSEAVWARVVTIDGDTKVVLSEPICKPRPL